MKSTHEIDASGSLHLESLLQGNASPPTASLRRRAEVLAQEFDCAPKRRLGWKLAVAMGALLFLAAILISPTAYAAVIMHRASQALDGVASATITYREVASGNIVSRYYYDRGRWRFEQPGQEVSIYRDGQMWTYRPDLNLLSKSPSDSPFSKGFSGFKLSSFLDETPGSSGNISVEDGIPINGRAMLRVTVLNAPLQERMVFHIDKETDLPVSLDAQKPNNETWKTMETVEFTYNKNLDARLFQPNFPKTAIDEDDAKAGLAEELNKNVVTLNDGLPNPPVIRQIDVNARGHIFIALTGSMNLEFRHMWITDDQGIQYLRGQLSASDNGSDVATRLDLFVNKKRVLAQWWIPSRPLLQRPKSLTIRATSGNDQHEIARVQAPVQAPNVATIPRYLLLLGGSPKDDLKMQLEEAVKQEGFAMSLQLDPTGTRKPISDNSGVPCLVSGGPGFIHSPKDLAFALQQADTALSLCDQIAVREHGVNASVKAQILFDKYEMLRYLGHASEALAALDEAEQLDRKTNYEKMKNWTF